ncbi:MAG TPA: Ig-like domain-containing protein [Jatrophihabitantaceae bacterium]
MARLVRRRRASISAAVVIVVAAAALVAYAVRAGGYTARHVDLNDGGIWVTNNADGLYGRLNKPIGQLDAGFSPPGGAQTTFTVDVVQEGSAVLAIDRGQGKIFPVDVTTGRPIEAQAAVVAGSDAIELQGGTAAVLDPATGKLWAARIAGGNLGALAALDSAAKPLATVGAQADLAVSDDGTVFAASAATQKLVELRPTANGFTKPSTTQLHRQMPDLALTSVGDTPVILDAKGGAVVLSGGKTITLPDGAAGTDLVLQQPGPKNDSVYVANSSALFKVPLDGKSTATLYNAGAGAPARPVVLGDCVHAAWGGTSGQYARSCNGKPAAAQKIPSQAKLSQPVFRVNRQQIVLNDLASGGVWIVDSTVQKVDDWQAIRPPQPKPNSKKPNKPTHQKQPCAQNRPPQPKPDTLGARPGRATVLHLTDNDSDPCGYQLAISAVSGVDGGATASIAADEQSVQVVVPADAGDVHFKYTVSDGHGLAASSDVTVRVRKGDINDAPALRPGYKPITWTVAAGSTSTRQVLSDWRDLDGDPLALTKATADQGSVAPTPDGAIVFTAPGTDGVQTIHYQVSDAIADPVEGTIKVNVLSRSSLNAVPAIAQPDVARAVVGQPVTLSPLANDVPGSDPTDPSAKLTLAAPLPQPIGATTTTDLAGGTVTVTPHHVGTLSLKYQAAFGSAKLASGTIRLDVVAGSARPLPPVAMPDTAVLHGQQAQTVDVLANDFDPSGDVLVVQRAVPVDDNSGLQIAVLQGHWLRVWSTQPVSPGARLIQYTVTDGVAPPVTGQVSVLQLPAPADDSPPTPVDDLATVRAGDTVDVPVLDNDIDPDGDPLSLKAGKLVTTPVGTGLAYVSGNVVRYAAPASVPTATQVVVDYVATDPSGATSVGHARITVNPLPTDAAHDQAPAPTPISRSVVAGDQITITVPWTGVDPDGDAVNVTGIASAPKLGRIMSTGPTTITYQAYPLAAGTDTFSYEVSDRFGLSGTATLRIGVVPPGDPQPPVAVDDEITAAPGVSVHVPVLGNDLTAPDDPVSIAPLNTTNDPVPDGASLQDDRVVVKAPPATGKPLIVSYAITDGTGGHSTAQVVVNSQPHYDIPPVARDDVAKVTPGATTSTVDVLANDDDPDGTVDALSISRTFTPAAHVVDRKLVVPVLAFPQVVAYELRDKGGATAMGVVHVPGNGSAQPHVKPDAPAIELGAGATKTINLADYVVDPANKPVRLTTTDRIWGSPTNGLGVTSKDQDSLVLTARKGYQGPASAIFEVTDGTSLSDPRAQKAVISLPVQIGKPQPVLRCPSSTFTAVQGGPPLKLDLAAVCHVWLDDPSTIGSVNFTSSWSKQLRGVSIVKNSNSKVTITPGPQARPGTSGTIKVGVAGSDVTATLNVRVIKAPPPTVSAITVRGLRAGGTQIVDVRAYVQSPIQGAQIGVLSAKLLSGPAIRVTPSGSKLTLSAPSGQIHGSAVFDLLVTDVPGAGHDDRRVTGRMTVQVLGAPGTPGTPSVQSESSHTVVVAFTPPAANGAPIDQIQLSDDHGGTHSCEASPCTVGGLKNGTTYKFRVRAHNVVSWSQYSAYSGPGKPDQRPDPVSGVAATPKDRAATVNWPAQHPDGSPVSSYQVQTSPAPSSGQSITTVRGTSTTISGLDNGTTYSIRVRAINAAGAGQWGSPAKVIPFGKPPQMPAPNAAGADSADNAEKAITVSWPAADGNGRAISTYTVTQYKNGAAAGTASTAGLSTSFSGLANDGSKYTYTVTAKNSGNLSSAPSPKSNEVLATAKPATVGSVSATDQSSPNNGYNGTIHVTFTLPQPHGASLSRVEYQVSGGPSGSWASPGSAGASVTESIGGLTNGNNYTAQVRGCNEANQCGDWSPASNQVSPYGGIDAPSASGSHSGCGTVGDSTGQITFNWSNGSGNGRPATYRFRIDGGGWQNGGNVPNGGSNQKSYACNSSHSVEVQVVRTVEGVTKYSGSATNTQALPKAPVATPSFTLSKGARHNASDCTTSACAYFHFVVTGFAPNTTYDVTFSSTQGHANTLSAGFTTDGNGSFTGDDTGRSYFGYTGDVVTAHAGGHDSNAYRWP